MKTKEIKNNKKIKLYIIIVSFILCLIIGYFYVDKAILNRFKTIGTSKEINETNIIISNAGKIDIDNIIFNNISNNKYREEIIVNEEELEYTTKYRKSSELYIGSTNISQEGRNGIQTITIKVKYDNNGNEVSREQVSAIITKATLDKIIEIGTKEKKIEEKSNENLSFDIALNRKSGLSLEQFKKTLTDSKDVNKIFENNAQYFYYIEDEYNINGIFVASIGIHESNWGTSSIAKNKYNLFGYGAYDSNPYNGAYTFEDYSESIDLIARVLVKYYLNPSGTTIYDGQKASGKYYNGNTLSAVNKKYASDTNWANCIYKYMKYFYDKI